MQLDDSEKTTLVGTELPEPEKIKIVEPLRENKSKFAWTSADIPGLDPGVAVHKLNIDPYEKKVVLKKRVFTLKRQKAIGEGIEKLKLVKFIREVQFPSYLDIQCCFS